MFGVLAIVVTFIAYFSYIRDSLAGKTKPHFFTWLTWFLATSIIFAIQVVYSAGSGARVTGFLVLFLFMVTVLSLRQGIVNVKPIDYLFLLFALGALFLWLVVDQPLLSMVILCAIDVLGFMPTVRKSWADPYSETLSLYVLIVVRFIFSIFALSSYNVLTLMFPLTWIVTSGLFVMMLLYRRSLPKTSLFY